MARIILIVGGFTSECDPMGVLKAIRERTTEAEVDWRWVKPNDQAFRLPRNPLINQLLYEPPEQTAGVTLVMLRCLNRDDKNKLLNKRPDPVRVPGDVTTGEALVEWLLDPNHGVLPPRHWIAPIREVAFFAILAKLLRNKSWANDSHGHNFTREEDLLGQSSVNALSGVRREANFLIEKMNHVLILTKGGSTQGTRKEWAIWIPRLAAAMNAFLDQSLGPLEHEPSLIPLLNYIRSNQESPIRVDGLIDVERIRVICSSNSSRTS